MLHFSSPLVVYPKAKQKRYAFLVLIPYILFSLWRVLGAYRTQEIISICTTLLTLAAVIWHVCAFVASSTRDITVVLYPLIVISTMQITDKVLSFVFSHETAGTLTLLFEIAFWGAFTFFFVRGICGKCKIILPMLFLFFGFFYAFIRYNLRTQLPVLSTQVTLFLLLWFILDAATFTSLPEEEKR